MKIRTLDEFEEKIQNDMIWRKIETHNFFTIIFSTRDEPSKRALLRASVPLLYSHWEGFIKNSISMYLSYIRTRKPLVNSLKPSFRVYAQRAKISQFKRSQWISSTDIDILLSLLGDEEARFESGEMQIETASNLNKDQLIFLLKSISCERCIDDMDISDIDENLVKKRNKISHGEYVQPTQEESLELRIKVFNNLEILKNSVINDALGSNFLAA